VGSQGSALRAFALAHKVFCILPALINAPGLRAGPCPCRNKRYAPQAANEENYFPRPSTLRRYKMQNTFRQLTTVAAATRGAGLFLISISTDIPVAAVIY